MNAETDSTTSSVLTQNSSRPAFISLDYNPRIPHITHFESDKLVVGRGYDAHLKILEKAISRRHCSVERSASNKWKITSHSRNAVEINNTSLIADQSRLLQCGDKINFAGVCSFVFKCNPDQNEKCCCDKTRRDIILVDLEDEEDSPRNQSSVSVISLDNSPSAVSTANTTTSPWPVPAEQIPNPITPIEEKHTRDLTILPELKDVVEEVEKYMNEANGFDDSVKKSMDLVKEKLNCLVRLQKFNQKFNGSVANLSKSDLLIVKGLVSECKTTNRQIESISFPMNHDRRLKDVSWKVNALLIEHIKRFSYFLVDLYEHSLSTTENCRNCSEKGKEATVESVSKNDIENRPENFDRKLKDELKSYKQNSEWQEARIQYLEMKLKERDELEKELKSAKEENELLQTQLDQMRSKLSKMKITELELLYLKETSKYREDDKRNKDELENQIKSLKQSLKQTREEVEAISVSKSLLERENMSLKQKCEEMEKRLNTKVGCSSNQATGEYCCDLFSSLKDDVLEALEKEFTCCICNELFVGATVTNCNHVFCGFCLREWKKKKKQCPFCRAALTCEYGAKVVDEFITNMMKLISDKMYAERMQMIEERKSVGVPPPPKRARRSRGNMSIMVNNHAFNPPAINIPFAHQNITIDLLNT